MPQKCGFLLHGAVLYLRFPSQRGERAREHKKDRESDHKPDERLAAPLAVSPVFRVAAPLAVAPVFVLAVAPVFVLVSALER